MIEEKQMMAVGDQQVLSEVSYDDSSPEITKVWIKSTIGPHVERNVVTIKHASTFDQEELEKQVESDRWRHAERVAAKASIRTVVPGMIQRTIGSPKVVEKARA